MTIRRTLAAVLLLSTATARADPPATQPASVSVGGDVPTPLTLSPDAFAALRHKSMLVKDHDGHDTTYEGVPVRDLLLKAGVPLGEKRLKGPLLGKAVVFSSADGYKVAFGLAEFDADYAERDILLADRRDGAGLGAKEAPFRLVVPQEARQGRWARMVTSIRVVSVP